VLSYGYSSSEIRVSTVAEVVLTVAPVTGEITGVRLGLLFVNFLLDLETVAVLKSATSVPGDEGVPENGDLGISSSFYKYFISII
jgi:hypothetical protein